MKFIDMILGLLEDGFNFVIDALFTFIEFLTKPLAFLLAFLEGIFYFITKIFEVAINVIMIFVALFQYFFAVVGGVFRTIAGWLSVSPSNDVTFRSSSNQGFQVVMDIVEPTGLLTVVPMVALAFLWLFFILKIIGVFGGNISISPTGGGGHSK